MAHTPEEQQFLLARQRICDGELPFLKSTFEEDGWHKIFDNSETYLLMACYYRQKSVIEFLAYQASRNINKPEVQNWLKVLSPTDNNPLHNYVCSSALAYRRKPRHAGLPILTSVLKLLVSLGFDVNEANSYGETPLYLTVNSADLLAVETLIDLGADVNTKCCVLQETVLHQACVCQEHDMMEVFLSAPGVDVNAVNMHGWSPLHLAAQKGDTYKVRRLVEKGACVDLQSVRGDTPIFFSVQNNSPENTSFSVLFDYIRSNYSKEDAAAQFKHTNSKGETLLGCAVRHENFTALKILLEEGLFDINHKDPQGYSLLHLCVSHAPNMEILSFLLENGLSPNEVDEVGNSALMYFFKQSRAAPRKCSGGGGVKSSPNVNV